MSSPKAPIDPEIEHIPDAKAYEDSRDLANAEDKDITVLQAIYHRPRTTGWALLAIWTCLLVSFEGQAGGMVLSIPRFRQDFGRPFGDDYVLDADWQSAFYGGPIAASVMGTFSAGYIADKTGRKPVILAATGLSLAAIGIQMAATTNAMFFGGKFLNGFVAGTLLSACVTYIGEVTPLALRGIATCLTALMMAVGPLIAAVIVDNTGTFDNRWAYRAVFCSQFGFAGVTAIAGSFMPESPVFLLSVGKDADDALRRLGYTSETERHARQSQIQRNLEQTKAEVEGATYLDCFRQSNLRRTIISVMPLAIQALSGVFFIASYGTYYIQLAGFSTRASFKLQIAQHACSVLGNICSWFLVDRVGRRALTFWGTFSITLILLVCAGLATAGESSPNAIKGSVALIVCYNFFYNMSIGATAYTLLCEVPTARLRIKTISVGVALQYLIYCLWAFVIPYLFNPDKANLGAKTAFLFGGLGVLCLVYLWFFQPETAGRSFEELDELFMKRVKVGEFANYQTDVQRRMKGMGATSAESNER